MQPLLKFSFENMSSPFSGSQTSVSGAASGDRTGRSQAGGSEGEHPNSSPTGAGDDQPVLGERTERLVDGVPAGVAVVSESGIADPAQLARLHERGVHGVLVGESLMRSADPAEAVRRLRRFSAAHDSL